MSLSQRLMSIFLVLTAAISLSVVPKSDPINAAQKNAPATESKVTLEQLCSGKLKIIDLSYALNEKNAFWPAPNYEAFQLKNIATLEQNGVLSKAFASPEHLGTHLDAPNHFERNQPSVDLIKAQNFFAPGVVVDITMQSETDSDYQLSVKDLQDWETLYGQVPEGAIVLLKTGWGQYWKNTTRYKNQDMLGQLHFPSFSAEAAKWLIRERKIKGIGIDTLSIDPGISKDFSVHHLINSAGLFGLENVAQLDLLPPRNFYLFVAPMKIETGTGGPTRIFAVL